MNPSEMTPKNSVQFNHSPRKIKITDNELQQLRELNLFCFVVLNTVDSL